MAASAVASIGYLVIVALSRAFPLDLRWNGADVNANDVRPRRLGPPENLPYKETMHASSQAPTDAVAWQDKKAPSLLELEVLAQDAYRRLPETFRALCEGLVIQVDDYATDEVLDSMGIKSELDLLGLFQGVGLPFRSELAPVQMPNMIWLYRVPILLYWAEHEESLGAVVTHVLVHEIGHHFGLSDNDIDAIEASVE